METEKPTAIPVTIVPNHYPDAGFRDNIAGLILFAAVAMIIAALMAAVIWSLMFAYNSIGPVALAWLAATLAVAAVSWALWWVFAGLNDA